MCKCKMEVALYRAEQLSPNAKLTVSQIRERLKNLGVVPPHKAVKAELVSLLNESESNPEVKRSPTSKVRYVRMYGKDPENMSESEVVVICDGERRTNSKVQCDAQVWVYPEESLCKFLKQHESSRHVPHPASLDDRYSVTKCHRLRRRKVPWSHCVRNEEGYDRYYKRCI